MADMPIPGEWTIGHGHVGNAPRQPSSTPLGWMRQQHQTWNREDALVWSVPGPWEPLRFDGPEETQWELWERRKPRNRVRIPGGIEFDARGYQIEGEPMERVRCFYVAEIPVDFVGQLDLFGAA